jgi:monoamine oxidase
MILGGGISGLYTAYRLMKDNPDRSLVVIEKTNRFGGRVHTYKDAYMTVEAGAGRFSKEHNLFIDLIHEFHLEKKMVPISSESQYSRPSTFTLKGVLLKIVVASKVDMFHDLSSMSLIEYATMIVSDEEVQFLKDAFGYYTELVIMNAKDAIHLLFGLNSEFFSLKGGLSQITDELVRRLRMFPNVTLVLNEEIVSITNHYTVKTTKNVYKSDFCVCALPKEALSKLAFSKPIRSKLNHIECAPLCRIYSTFDKPWFKDLPKLTSPSPLRMIIPYSKNTIMISYTDNKFAEFWRDVYAKHGEQGLNRVIHYYIQEELGISIPKPLKTNIFFWDCGVGYWGVGANSQKIASQLVEPFPRFFICGEHYSAKHQQWMEGALETSDIVLQRIKEKYSTSI